MTFAIQARSAFKYLLAGLLLSLLVVNSNALPTNANRRSLSLVGSDLDDLEMRAPVKKAPPPKKVVAKKATAKKALAKKAPAKKAPGKKAPAKAGGKAHAKKGSAVAAGAACPMRKPGKKLGKRSLYKRSGPTSHPSSASPATLFHGSSSKASADSAAGAVDLSKTASMGDYHKRGGSCDGGFYLTDSLFAAAQFVCHQDGQPPHTTAYVNEYTWTPPAGLKRHAYTEAGPKIDNQAEKDCKAYDILEGPMNGPFDTKLHKDFYQYTITNQKTAAGLKFVKQYTIPCENVTPGKDLDSSVYQMGQRSNAGFTPYANQLEGKC